MRVRETIEATRPQAEVYATLAQPERRAAGSGWSSVSRSGDAYTGVLHASAGPVAVDFDCRFEVVEAQPPERLRLRGVGSSPRLGFTFDVAVAVSAADGGSRVVVDGDVDASGTLAGLGQRRLGEQARRLLTAFVEGA
jgi:carbon monoxide dehydrogenase subunit G